METTVYDTFLGAIFKSLRFHLSTLESERFQKAPNVKNTALIFLELFSSECCAVLVEPPMMSSLSVQKRKYLLNEKRYSKKENTILLYFEKPFK